MTKRYIIEVDYESPTEWSVGASGSHGDGATKREIATVLETVVSLLRANFDPNETLPVRYPGRSM